MTCRSGLKMLSTFMRIRTFTNPVLASSQRCFSVSTKLDDSVKIQDSDDFKAKVLESTKPIVVDFFATWCTPCRMIGPRIETVIAEKGGKVNFAKVDIDELADIALDYKVASVPVLVFIKNGIEEGRLIGLHDEDKIRSFVNKFVPS